MRKIRIHNLRKAGFAALLTLPLLYGCGGGGSGGDSASAGSVFSSAASLGTETINSAAVPDEGLGSEMAILALFPDEGDGPGMAILASVPEEGVGSEMAKIHNPEPATMLLLGGGMLAFGFVKHRKRARQHS